MTEQRIHMYYSGPVMLLGRTIVLDYLSFYLDAVLYESIQQRLRKKHVRTHVSWFLGIFLKDLSCLVNNLRVEDPEVLRSQWNIIHYLPPEPHFGPEALLKKQRGWCRACEAVSVMMWYWRCCTSCRDIRGLCNILFQCAMVAVT